MIFIFNDHVLLSYIPMFYIKYSLTRELSFSNDYIYTKLFSSVENKYTAL